MKFLHTADLHLGKVFHEQPLLEDQRYMLEGLTAILEDASYRALLIAGDVYDRAIPQTEAVRLFSDFLVNLKRKRDDLAVLILPGNHDSSSRLGFGRELFSSLGIHFVTNPEDAGEPVMVRGNDGRRCAFFLLPFLNPGSLMSESGEPIRSQAALAEEAAARLAKARTAALAGGADYTALGAHLFTTGGAESASERVFLGTAERVGVDLFADFDYLGLGHLHRFQRAGENAWYAGSPLAYSFEEAKYEKVFLSVELEKPETEEGGKAALQVTPLPVVPRRKLRSLRGDFSRFFDGQDAALREAADDYLEITLTGKELTENPLALLRPRFPYVLSIKQEAIKQEAARQEASDGGIGAQGGERRNVESDFQDFLTSIYGAADSAETALFQELLREIDAGEPDL